MVYELVRVDLVLGIWHKVGLHLANRDGSICGYAIDDTGVSGLGLRLTTDVQDSHVSGKGVSALVGYSVRILTVGHDVTVVVRHLRSLRDSAKCCSAVDDPRVRRYRKRITCER